jgi:hypothetical protein
MLHLGSLPARAGHPEMAKKAVRVDGLLQPSHHPEELEGVENQVIVAPAIRASLAQADPPETLGPRDHKRCHSLVVVEVAVVLAPVNFRPRSPIVRALDRSALQRTPTASPDRVLPGLDPEDLEIKANQPSRLGFRAELRVAFEVGSIPREVTGTIDAARGDLDNASVVDFAAAVRCQIGNDRKEHLGSSPSFLLSLCLSCFLSFFLSLFLSFFLSLFLSVFISFFLSLFLSFFISFCLSFCLSFFLSFFLSLFLSFSLSFSLRPFFGLSRR